MYVIEKYQYFLKGIERRIFFKRIRLILSELYAPSILLSVLKASHIHFYFTHPRDIRIFIYFHFIPGAIIRMQFSKK